MRRSQGHELLLDAVELLPDGNPLVIALSGTVRCGPGGIPGVGQRRAGARVRFVTRHDDAAGLLAAADIVLHTSQYGAAPTALLRAMAAGVPVVATRVGGVPEIVTPGTGILVAVRPADRRRAGRAGHRFGPPAAAGRRGPGPVRQGDFEAVGWARRLNAVYESVLKPPQLSRRAEPGARCPESGRPFGPNGPALHRL